VKNYPLFLQGIFFVHNSLFCSAAPALRSHMYFYGMQKILLTGANGFIGHYIIGQLLMKGHEVIATGRASSQLRTQHPMLQYVSMNFTEKGQVDQVFEHCQPSVVIHSGAVSKPDECEADHAMADRINVHGTKLLLDASRKFQSFFIFLSTDFVFDGKKGMYKEDDERSAVNYYGETKIMAEDAVMKYPFQWSIVRTISVYGKNYADRPNIVPNVANTLRAGKTMRMFGDQVRTPVYVEDLAQAIVQVVERNKTGIFHIGGEDIRTPYQMAVETAEYLELDAGMITEVTEDSFQQPARRPLKTGFDITKAKRELDFCPLSFPEGLKRTFASEQV
jgi:dTDP-4-dehydrorhamnose reductase